MLLCRYGYGYWDGNRCMGVMVEISMAFMSAISLSPFFFVQPILLRWNVGTFLLCPIFTTFVKLNSSTIKFVLKMSNRVLR